MPFHLIVAIDQHSRIGIRQENKFDVLYPIPHDLKFFSHTTKGDSVMNAVVMGHNTWKSLPTKFKPLPDRLNIILSRTPDSVQSDGNNVMVKSDFNQAITDLENLQKIGKICDIFVMGGSNIYEQALDDVRLKKVYLTRIQLLAGAEKDKTDKTVKTVKTDIDDSLEFIKCSRLQLHSSDMIWASPYYRYTLQRGYYKDRIAEYQFCVYQKTNFVSYLDTVQGLAPTDSMMVGGDNYEERQYLELLQKVVEYGDRRTGRNGATRSIFGVRMEFNLKTGKIPLLTTKKMAWKTVIRELLWFLSGDTNAKTLQDQKVRIWDGNSSREYLDSIGLTDREVGDLGPVYGFQWRHFGADYQTCHDDYTGQGVDQIMECLRQIRETPTSRRILFTGWNPKALSEMALPPCHLLCQFFVESDDYLSLQLYQRSGDSFLGIPFNIFSYSALLIMFSQLTGKKPGRMIHVVGDFHIYENHLEAVTKQLQRAPRCFPSLSVVSHDRLEDYTIDDFTLHDYNPWSGIKAPMAA